MSGGTPAYVAIANAFAAEGVDTVFTLMGDRNMHFCIAMRRDHGARLIHCRHEHSTVVAADGYARKTGRVGVASVTSGPGFTQIATGLTAAVRRRVPLVVFAGDAAQDTLWHSQMFDQGPLAIACGAHYIPLKSLDRLNDNIREAFFIARSESRPVVLSLPFDLQLEDFKAPPYTPATRYAVGDQAQHPDTGLLQELAVMLAEAKKPIIIAGRGAAHAQARGVIEAVADRAGALLAASLGAKDMFTGHPYDLGTAGVFSSNLARAEFAEADLVVGIGAGMGFHTRNGGKLFPKARLALVDLDPKGLRQGQKAPDLQIVADARLTAEALLGRLSQQPEKRDPALPGRLASEIYDTKEYQIPEGQLDPRAALLELDRVIPKNWDIVCGGGHNFNFIMTHMKGRAPEYYHAMSDFGPIGQALPASLGVAAARIDTEGDGGVVVLQGEGSLLMHIQELEVIARQNLHVLVVALNDGAYGSEVHHLRGHGDDPSDIIFGRPDLDGIARSFGLRGATITQPGKFAGLFEAHHKAGKPELWDVHIADIPSIQFRRTHYGEK